jgi:hypothetical protein
LEALPDEGCVHVFQGGTSLATRDAAFAARIEKDVRTTSPLKVFLSRYFYFSMSLVMAGLIVWGFSRTVDANLIHARPQRPLLLWMHGTAFAMWPVFFILQSALVRTRKVSVHRLLGWFGAGLATAMVMLGLSTSVVMTRFDVTVLHQKNIESFMAIPFSDMIVFGTCIALTILWRTRPDYHRRLVFIASCVLMDAAIGRFDFWFNHSIFHIGLDLLIALGLMRDWIVDGRVHKVYLYALPPLIVLQSLAVYAWRVNPAWWQATTRAILG